MFTKLPIILALTLTTFLASAQQQEPELTQVEKRIKSDRQALSDPFVITQYKRNYILPVSYINSPNQIGNDDFSSDKIDHLEAKYQLSVKMPIYLANQENLEGLFFGFTAVSFWQVYNNAISKPFRETNYEPEIFYNFDTDEFSILGYKFNGVQLGFNHQSNGQNQLRSRSWNRLWASILFSSQDSYYFLKSWYRLPEEDKQNPLDPSGDDNPDITHFLGHFELGYGTRFKTGWGDFKLHTQFRNNLKTSDNKGSIELNLSYPINDRYEILLQYFNGYGDSLIDYNRHQQRVGIGIQLSFL